MQIPLYQGAASAALNALSSILAPAVPSQGCGRSLPDGLSPGGLSVNFTLSSPQGGGERRYLIHLPEAFSRANAEPAPLILAFHGMTQTTTSIEEVTGFSDPSFNRHSIAVYPEGINYRFLGDPESPRISEINDVEFVSDLLDDLTEKFCIDTSRIYAAGLSNGGGLTALLACSPKLSIRIAAFAGSAAAYYTDESLGEPLFNNCSSSRHPIPFLEFHGDNDTIIRYDGDNTPDPNTIPIVDYFSQWAHRNRCDNSNANFTQSLQGGNLTRYSWNCGGWIDTLVHYRVKGFGHGWPSTTPTSPILEWYRHGPATFNATTIIMEYFSKWSLPTKL